MAILLCILWYCFDDQLAVYWNNPSVGHYPVLWVFVVAVIVDVVLISRRD